jgi:hypothetical protein
MGKKKKKREPIVKINIMSKVDMEKALKTHFDYDEVTCKEIAEALDNLAGKELSFEKVCNELSKSIGVFYSKPRAIDTNDFIASTTRVMLPAEFAEDASVLLGGPNHPLGESFGTYAQNVLDKETRFSWQSDAGAEDV